MRRIQSSLAVALFVALLFPLTGCGAAGGGGNSGNNANDISEWDYMEWNQDNWE